MGFSIWNNTTPCANRTVYSIVLGGLLVSFFATQATGGYRSKVGVLPEIDELIHALKAMSLLVIGLIVLQFFFSVTRVSDGFIVLLGDW